MSKDRVVDAGSRIKEEDRIKEIDTGLRIKGKTKGMKDSGVEWIGEIPEDWEIVKFNKVIKRIATGLNPRDNFVLGKGNNYYVTIKNFKNGVLYLDDKCDKIDNEALNTINKRSDLRVNDILFASIGTEGQAYLIKKTPQNWNINESVFTIRVNPKILNPKLLYYIIISSYFYNSLSQGATGSTFQSIKIQALKRNTIVIPPMEEQQKIANFLDGKVSLIDDTIEKTKQSIEDYKKYKQALITETVTKGLNPDVEMKDSGVEWIGEIPEDWEVIKLRYLGALQNGISKSGDEFGYGSPFVSYSDVYKNYSLPPKVVGLINSTREEKQVYSVQKGDVFFTRTSETIEEVGFSSTCLKTIEDAVFAGFVIRFRPFTRKLNENFSKYYFRSELHRRFFVKEMDIVTRASLSQELLKKLPVIIPPVLEQQQIADYLDNKCSEIDKIISEKEKLIKDLEIYKKSLIYEYVTGKKQV